MGWPGNTKGEELRAAASHLDCFVTGGANLAHQNQVSALTFGVLVVRGPSNRLADLRAFILELQAALAMLQPGQIVPIPQEPPA